MWNTAHINTYVHAHSLTHMHGHAHTQTCVTHITISPRVLVQTNQFLADNPFKMAAIITLMLELRAEYFT